MVKALEPLAQPASRSLPQVVRDDQARAEMSVQELVSETYRLVASATHLVNAIEKNVASASRLAAETPTRIY